MTLKLRQRLRSGALLLSLLLFPLTLNYMSPFMILGTRLGRAARIPHLHLEPAADSCGKCKTCESRCPMSLDVSTMVASGSMYNAECILCGSCVDGCPKGAIQYAFGTAAGNTER